jgi:hypothetical protein
MKATVSVIFVTKMNMSQMLSHVMHLKTFLVARNTLVLVVADRRLQFICLNDRTVMTPHVRRIVEDFLANRTRFLIWKSNIMNTFVTSVSIWPNYRLIIPVFRVLQRLSFLTKVPTCMSDDTLPFVESLVAFEAFIEIVALAEVTTIHVDSKLTFFFDRSIASRDWTQESFDPFLIFYVRFTAWIMSN